MCQVDMLCRMCGKKYHTHFMCGAGISCVMDTVRVGYCEDCFMLEAGHKKRQVGI